MNWTKSEIEFLTENYGKLDLYLIAWKLRRRESAVVHKYRDLLRKEKTKIIND